MSYFFGILVCLFIFQDYLMPGVFRVPALGDMGQIYASEWLRGFGEQKGMTLNQ